MFLLQDSDSDSELEELLAELDEALEEGAVMTGPNDDPDSSGSFLANFLEAGSEV